MNDNNASDKCRHPGRRDRPFSGDGPGYEVSHSDYEATDGSGFFKPGGRLIRTPPGAERIHREMEYDQQSMTWSERGTRGEGFDSNPPERRHSSPEEPREIELEGKRPKGTKRSFDSGAPFSSPSLVESRSVRMRKEDLEGGVLPSTKKKRKNNGQKREPTTVGELVKEAVKIRDNLRNFLSAKEKRINMANQEHIGSRADRLVEIIETMAELVGGVIMKPPEVVPGDPDESTGIQDQKDKLVDELMGKVTAVVNEGIERAMSQMALRMNTMMNQAVKEDKQRSPQPGRASKGYRESTRDPTVTCFPRSDPEMTGEEQSWSKVGKKKRPTKTLTFKGTQLRDKSDLWKLIPSAGEHRTEKEGSVVVNVLVDVEEGDLDVATRAATIVEAVDVLDPAVLGEKVKKASISKSGRLIIKAADPQAADDIARQIQEKTVGSEASKRLKCRVLLPRCPRIRLSGVPQAWTKERTEAFLKGKIPTGEERRMRVLFKRGLRSLPTARWIVEVDPATRAEALAGHIRWGVLALQCDDYWEQPRCYRCQQYGHIAKSCRQAESICGWCAGKGHAYKNCPNKANKPICSNCVVAGKNSRHSTDAENCPTLLAYLASRIDSTSYV